MEENKTISRTEINEQFKQLLNGNDIPKLLEEVAGIKAQYDEAHRAEYQKQLQAFLETEIVEEVKKDDEKEVEIVKPKEENFKFSPDQETHRFKELYILFQEKKKEYKQALAKQEEENFIAKSKVVEDLKALTEKEFDSFGAMFNTFKELQEKWKSVGEVNKARFQTLQTEYSLLIDKFFYNVNIHKGLQNYSFEKNSAEKKKIIAKLKELVNNDSIIQLEHYIKKIQKEWDEIGPTFQEEWDNIKTEYWDSINAVYGKIREHYLKIREKQKESIEKKEALIVEAKTHFEALQESSNPKQWNELSNKLKELQQAWKKTGFSKKTKDDELWQTFRGISNEFFDQTKALYKKLNEKRDVFEEKKLVLIKKAEALKDSKDWRETTQAYLKLQEAWKKTGSLQAQKDYKLWNKFRGACNAFFDNKKEFFNTLDDRQANNLKKRESLNKEIESIKSVDDLKDKIAEWWATGHVPKKAINSITSKFNNAIDKATKALEIGLNKKEDIVFEAKVKAYKASEDAQVLLKNEIRFVKEKIDKIKDEIHLYENNLSFFGPSKGAQKLKEVVEKKVTTAKEQLLVWEKKMKMLK